MEAELQQLPVIEDLVIEPEQTISQEIAFGYHQEEYKEPQIIPGP